MVNVADNWDALVFVRPKSDLLMGGASNAMMPASSIIDHGSTDQERDAESAEDTLLRVASAAHCFRSTDGRFHARLPVEDRHETYGLKSLEFRDWLIERYRGRAERSSAGECGRPSCQGG